MTRIPAAAVAIGLASLTIAVISVLVIGQPIRINADSITALGAWASYASALGTSLLLAAALLAWRATQRQITQTEEHFRRSQRLAVLPVVEVSDVAFSAPDDAIEVLLQNVGIGPALKVGVEAWAYPYERNKSMPEQLTLLEARQASLSTGVEPAPPHLIKKAGSINANGRKGPIALIPSGSFEPSAIKKVAGLGSLLWRVRYSDVFGALHVRVGATTFIPAEQKALLRPWVERDSTANTPPPPYPAPGLQSAHDD
jgi:hypothetical protein